MNYLKKQVSWLGNIANRFRVFVNLSTYKTPCTSVHIERDFCKLFERCADTLLMDSNLHGDYSK